MRRISAFVCALFIAACFGLQTASAQLPGGIKIPKIPKREKAQPATTPAEAPRPAPSEEATPNALPGAPAATTAARPQAGGPRVIKTRVQFRAKTVSSYKETLGVWSWVPEIKFDAEGGCRAARTTTSRSRSPAAARG